MFGFLQSPGRACCSSESHLWRGYFCGLANTLHRDYGRWARFLVNRDSTFLSLLGGISSPPPTRLATCCNPVGPLRPVCDQGWHVQYAAAVTICALSAKLSDDASDERGPRRWAAQLLGAGLTIPTDRAIATLNSANFPTARIQSLLHGRTAIESGRPTPVIAAEPTARAYGEITAFTGHFQDAPLRDTLRRIGHSLGRLIYWDDAWRDAPADQRRKRFNVLAYTPAPELRGAMHHEFQQLTSLTASLPDSPAKPILLSTLRHTATRIPGEEAVPGPLIMSMATGNKSQVKKKRDHWWDTCFDCCHCGDCSPSCGRGGSGSCADKACDCGPGDSGCCDCCPCDGCDCS